MIKEGEDYCFQDGFLIDKTVEDSKVYLHLERENNLEHTRMEAEKMGVLSLMPNLAGKILEVSGSTFIFSEIKTDSKEKKIK